MAESCRWEVGGCPGGVGLDELDDAFHVNAGLPGGAEEIRLLHFAIDGLILDQLTPGTGRPYDIDAITSRLVRRLAPTLP